MAYYNESDQMGPRRKALVDSLGGNTGVSGMAPGGVQPPPIGGAPAPAAPAAPSAFQSGNASVSGYLTDAMRDYAPTLRGIKDEAGRKSALNQYLTSLTPEVEKRGGHISDIHGDGANVNGRRIDFFRDIEGAADPQYLDVTDQGKAGGARPMFAGSTVAPMLQGDAQSNIQQAMQNMGGLADTSRLQQLIAALNGGGQ